jgi:hypothetical protein
MNALADFLASLFNALFSIVPLLGKFTNHFLFFAGAVASLYWIRYSAKDPEGDENYLSK